MEWVEVRGESVAAAEELALDQLGVARTDAEFEIVQAPESRWLGFKKTEARVRARVKPSTPPPKNERRPRRKRGSDNRNDGARSNRSRGADRSNKGRSGNENATGSGDGSPKAERNADRDRGRDGGNRGRRRSRSGGGGPRDDAKANDTNTRRDDAPATKKDKKEKPVNDNGPTEAMSLDAQKETLTTFLDGVVAGFGVDATTSTTIEDDILVGSIDGDDVGLFIGPRAGTLRAIQEIARTTMQREAQGRDTSRLAVDVAGYRERRRNALAAFTAKVAQQVIETGTSVAMEPMGSADRKAVHDAAGEIDGITSASAGQDPNRHVVLHPAGAEGSNASGEEEE